MTGTLAVIFTLGLPFLAIGGGLYLKYKRQQQEHLERLKMIENGLLTADTEKKKTKPFSPVDTLASIFSVLIVILLVYGGLLLLVSGFQKPFSLGEMGWNFFHPIEKISIYYMLGLLLCYMILKFKDHFALPSYTRVPLFLGTILLSLFLMVHILKLTVRIVGANGVVYPQKEYSLPLFVPAVGHGDSLTLPLESFSDYDPIYDKGNYLVCKMVHDNDSLYIQMNGIDSFPEKRVLPEPDHFVPGHDYSCTDRIRISIQYGLTSDSGFTYSHILNGKGSVRRTYGRQIILGVAPEDHSHGFSVVLNGRAWSYRTAFPLRGSQEIRMNLRRKYYGGREVILYDKLTGHPYSHRIFAMQSAR